MYFKCALQHEKEPRSDGRRWGWARWAVRVQAYHSEDAIPLCHIHNNPQEEQLLPSVHAQISILFCTPLSIIAALFFSCSFFLGRRRRRRCRNRGGERLKEWGWHGRRGKGGRNEKERLVFMPGSQRACKSPRSVVEDSRRLIVIHHS